jgi:hypothetical protein
VIATDPGTIAKVQGFRFSYENLGFYNRSDLHPPVRPVKVTGHTFDEVNWRKTSERHRGRILSGRCM